MSCQSLAKPFFVEKVAACGANEQFLCRGLAVQSPEGALWGLCGPCGACRARVCPLALLTPRYARCWAILAAWPVKLANQPERPPLTPARPTVLPWSIGEGGATPRTDYSLLIFKELRSTLWGVVNHSLERLLICFVLDFDFASAVGRPRALVY